jgi:predicted N-formylglutamate amidohydrolase
MTDPLLCAPAILGREHAPSGLVITCEHASNAVPPPLEVGPGDRAWLDSHWGWDLGAEEVVRELVLRRRAVAVCARHSRLVCDANRPPDHPTWILTEIDGQPIGFNQHLDDGERERRRRCYHQCFHDVVDRTLGACCRRSRPAPLLLSVHTFTPELHGEVRSMEIGVLFHDFEPLAERLASLIAGEGFAVALNEPYSGRAGLAYSAFLHGRSHGVPYLELEVRQDLVATPDGVVTVAARIDACLARLVAG